AMRAVAGGFDLRAHVRRQLQAVQGQLSAAVIAHRNGRGRLLAFVALVATQLALGIFAHRLAAAETSAGLAPGGQAYRNNSRVAVDGALLAVVQPRLHAVVVFDARPTVPTPLFAVGRYGHQAGDLIRPTGIAISARRDLLFVSDTDNDRLVVFRLERDT